MLGQVSGGDRVSLAQTMVEGLRTEDVVHRKHYNNKLTY